jgi:hypothetical protein
MPYDYSFLASVRVVERSSVMTMYRLAFVMRVYASFLCNPKIKISCKEFAEARESGFAALYNTLQQ